MANRVPLILNTSSNQIQELPTGDNLDLSNSGIHNAGVITATSFTGDGSALTGITAAGTGAIGGLTIKDEGSVVGTAGSISSFDFRGSYITATANTGAAGVTTVTVSETPTFSAVTVTNNINANGNIVGDNSTNITGIAGVTASTLTGTLQTAAQPNITSLGTLSSLNVTGNVSVGGTLTYEDVTNVDSVGLVTARNGIKVLAGGINAVGVVTATSFVGDGSALTGITQTTINNNADNRLITGSGTANTLEAEANLTFDGSRLHLPDEKSIEFGDGYDLGIGHTSFNGYIHNKTNSLTISSQDHVKIRTRNLTSQYSGGDKAIECLQGGTVELYGANAKKLETTSSGVTITGTCQATAFTGSIAASNIDSGTVATARLGSGTANSSSFLRGDQTWAAVTSTTINNNADNRLITGSGTSNTLNGEASLTFDGTNLDLPDSKKIRFGSGNDFELFHDGSNTIFAQTGDGNMFFKCSDVTFQSDDGSVSALAIDANGGITLKHANTTRFETSSSGVTITGTVAATAFTGDGSALTGITGTTINTNADNRIITGSGTANTLNGEANFTFDGSALKVKSTHSLASYVQRTDGVWGNWSPEFNFKATGASPAGTTFGQWGNHNEGHQIVFVKSRNNGDSGTTCQAGDDLGSIFWSPYNSANPGCSAAVKVMADSGTWSSTSNPAYMQIMTTPNGSKEPTERLRIAAHGGVIFKGGPLQEKVKITAGKLSSNNNIDLADGNVHYFTTQESTTSTPNLRVNSSITLDSVMAVGETVAVTIITTAAAAGYSAQLQIDGANVTENWVGGSAPAAGGSSGVDIYNYTIIKTGSSAFTVIGNLTKTSA